MAIDIDFGKLLSDLTEAAQKTLSTDWEKVRGPLKVELTALAAQTYEIKQGLLSGELPKRNEDIYEQLIRNRVQGLGVLLVGIATIIIQDVINAILDVIKEAMKGLLDFI